MFRRETEMAANIGQRNEATKIKRGIGGKAFPNDYNWVCRECGEENRSWNPTCQYCTWEVEVNQAGYALPALTSIAQEARA